MNEVNFILWFKIVLINQTETKEKLVKLKASERFLCLQYVSVYQLPAFAELSFALATVSCCSKSEKWKNLPLKVLASCRRVYWTGNELLKLILKSLIIRVLKNAKRTSSDVISTNGSISD